MHIYMVELSITLSVELPVSYDLQNYVIKLYKRVT